MKAVLKFSKICPIVFGLFFMIIQVSCNSDDDCSNSICTLEFVTYSISVVDENQNPVALSSFIVEDLENGNDITVMLTAPELEEAQQQGAYPLITDGVFGVNQEKQIRFRGFINNEEVISEDYTVATDCCHVSLVSGDIQLVL